MPANEGGVARPADPLAGLPDLGTFATYGADLRQVPTDVAAIEAALGAARERLEQARAAGDQPAALSLHGYDGNGLRILGRHDQAIAHQERAVALAGTLNRPKAQVVSLIRLGETHRNADNYPEARRCFGDALDRIRANRAELGAYEDFALQHLGKCLTDAGRAIEAIPCLEEALALRRTKGDPELIASTEAALTWAREAARPDATER